MEYILAATIAAFVYFGMDSFQGTKNLDQIKIGMTKEQVLTTLGEPLTSETYNTPNIWFYPKEEKWWDGNTTRDECTPLVFDKAGLLAGWGQDYYKKNVSFK
jgi:outer membrane protein assembly factor BamE (lipoprotein component of BamABCDE complex)